ncbi:unnamed protein product [Larinioides sclopetarius]|uniref:Protein DEK n=1 Tax=Larinioides sclopetarius TaxID=280406 RepID=A0AAV1YVN6_9ARAC
MSGTPPESPEVEEGSPFGGAECDDSSPEPAQQIPEDHEQGEENLFPFVNVSVELFEGPDAAANAKSSEQNNEASNTAAPKSPEVENVETTPDLNLHMDDEDDRDNVPDSTGPGTNENSLTASDVYDTTVVKSEPVDADYKQLHKTYIEDFIYSNASSFDEGSNSNFDDSREEHKGSPLSRFSKIVKAVEQAEYETLQVLFQLLYQRSAWDTQEVLAHGILEFSGFNFSPNSEDYFNREMLLRTQPDEMLAKIGILLGLEQHVQKMLTDLQKARPELITGIMYFLSKPSKKTRTFRSVEEKDEPLPATTAAKRPVSKCGCRNNCILQFTRFEQNRLLEYSRELDKKKLLESYLVNLMECKKIKRSPEEIENSRKLKEYCYNYMVKFDTKEVNVCKGGFCILHGLKLGRVSQLQNRVKTGSNLPKKIDMKDFSPIISEEERKAREVAEAKKVTKRSSPRKKQQQTPAQQPPSKKVWVSSEEQIRRMEQEMNGTIDKSCAALPKVLLEKIDVKLLQKSSIADKDLNSVPAVKEPPPEKQPEIKIEEKKTVKLKDFPLVVKAVEDAPQELLVDVHFLLFLTGADDDKVKSNILEFEGFSFDSDTEEYDERNEFLQRMTFKIVCDVARAFSLAVMNTKEDTINNLLKFLSKPDENFLTTTVSMPLSLSDVELDDLGDLSDSDGSITCEVVEKKVECIDLLEMPKTSSKRVREYRARKRLLCPQEVHCGGFRRGAGRPMGTQTGATHTREYRLRQKLRQQKEGLLSPCGPRVTSTGADHEENQLPYEENYNLNFHKLSSGEDSDGEGKKSKSPKKSVAPATTKPITPIIVQTSVVSSVAQDTPTTSASVNTPASKSSGKTRCLRDFETIGKIVNTHPHEYLVDIYELLYLKKHDPASLRDDILNFTGFTFEMKSPEYIKRKQLLDRMLYNSVRRIYNTLIHNTTEVKVFSKPTMITEIFQFLFNLPDHDTSVRPPPPPKPISKPLTASAIKLPSATGVTPPAGLNLPNQSGKLSDLKRVFQRVACFPCEYLTDVHKLLFMTECDAKVIRQNIFAFKGFNFDVDSQEFQQRKMYLEYLTFHSLRKISSVLTTRSVDLRNSTKHELATHLTQVLAEYTKLKIDDDVLPPGVITSTNQTQTSTSSVSSTTAVENIVVTPTIYPTIESATSVATATATKVVTSQPTSNVIISQATSSPLAISIVDARSVSTVSNTKSSPAKRKRKSTPSKQAKKKEPEPATPFADVNLPEVEQYKKLYGQNLGAYQAPIAGIAVVPVVSNYSQPIQIQGVQQPGQLIGIPQTIPPTIVTKVPSKQTEIIVPEKNLNSDADEPATKRKKNKLENEPENIACDQLVNEVETPDVVDQVESAGINSTSQEEESYETTPTKIAVKEDMPAISKKWRAVLEKRMNEAYLILKQVAAKPKMPKDESQIFSDLMCLKLRTLDEDTRKRAMNEINKLILCFSPQA